MSKVEDFLTKAEEEEVVEAIRLAEKNTSGEIRVHLEKKTSLEPLERVREVFQQLKMHETKDRNGVLIYIAVKSKKFAIFGDDGINAKVPTDFWDCTKDIILEHLKAGNHKLALVKCIENAGNQLKKHFPFLSSDTNELSNEISKG